MHRGTLVAAFAAALLILPLADLAAVTAQPAPGLLPTHHDARPAGLQASPILPQRDTSAVLLKDWLLVQDNVPWGYDSIADALNRYGYTWDSTTSWAVPFITLADYRGVIIASDQAWSFHDNMAANVLQLQAYVLAGGTLVVNYAQEGWNSYPANPVQWVPGGTTFSIALSDSLLITNPASPITAGITDLDLQGWGYSTHGNLLGPAANVIIVEPTTLGPTFIAYPYGLGKVYVTMQTVEYGYVYDYTGAQHHLLRNELTTILLPVPL